jgi:hypothetical protein
MFSCYAQFRRTESASISGNLPATIKIGGIFGEEYRGDDRPPTHTILHARGLQHGLMTAPESYRRIRQMVSRSSYLVSRGIASAPCILCLKARLTSLLVVETSMTQMNLRTAAPHPSLVVWTTVLRRGICFTKQLRILRRTENRALKTEKLWGYSTTG